MSTTQRHTARDWAARIALASALLTGVVLARAAPAAAAPAVGPLSWGDNASGQLGIGSAPQCTGAVQFPAGGASGPLEGAVAISAGAFHGLALKGDGTVLAWGLNDFGELGDGTRIRRDSPVAVRGPGGMGHLTDVRAIAAGNEFSLALRNDGSVWAWGSNARGQLGNGTTTDSAVPVPVRGVNGAGFLGGVTAISASPGHPVARGSGPGCVANLPLARGGHSLALTSAGTVLAWGSNDAGQLGDGTTADRTSPVTVSFSRTVNAIAAGGRHSLLLTGSPSVPATDEVWAWGANDRSQLGATPYSVCPQAGGGTILCSAIPVRAQVPSGVRALAAGGFHNLALRNDGTVWAWGANDSGQLGDGTTVTQRTNAVMAVDRGVTGIDAGFEHSVALERPGMVLTWGANGAGQLGGPGDATCAGVVCRRGSARVNFIEGALTLDGAVEVSAGGDFTLVRARGLPIFNAEEIDFPATPVGKTSTQAVQVWNSGSWPLTIGSITTDASEFTHSTDCPRSPDVLPPYATCHVAVTFRPTAGGNFGASLWIEHNAQSSPQRLILTGEGLGAGLDLDKTKLDFGHQKVNTSSAEQTVTLTNTGQGSLTVTHVDTGTYEFVVTRNTCTAAVAPKGTCELGVTFTPSSSGSLTDTLTISTNASGGATRTIPLAGTGALPGIALSPAGVSFGQQRVGGTSPARAVVLTNTGSVPLEISSIVTDPEFPLAAPSSCPLAPSKLAPGATCQVEVAFRPAWGGSRNGHLSIANDAPGAPHQVLLVGTGVLQPAIEFEPTALSFGDQPTGTSGAPRTLTIRNAGSTDLTLSSVTVAGTNAGDFSVTPSCDGAVLAPERSCSVGVVFQPSALGARAAELSVASNDPGAPHGVSLSGNGVAPPPVALDPTAIDFGDEPVSTVGSVRTVTLTNHHGSGIVVEAVELLGVHPSDFSLGMDECSGMKVANGGKCLVEVSFAPGAAGNRAASLSFVVNGVAGPHAVELTGRALGPAVAFDPPSLAFGDQPVGSFSSEARTVTVTNTGTAPLSITGVSVSGDFVHSHFCSSVVPGGYCTITLRFHPSALGLRTGEIAVISNAPGSPQVVSLSGTGT